MKKFAKNLIGVAVVSGITYFLCGIYAGNWDLLTWQLGVKGVFIAVVAIVSYVNLLDGNGMN